MLHLSAPATANQNHNSSDESEPHSTPAFRKPNIRLTNAGISLVEVMIALGLLAMTIVGSVQALLVSNRLAASNRIMTAARAIVQRNIDMALTLRFDANTAPPILGITSTSGATYEDEQDGDGTVTILTQKNAAGNLVPLVKGTLRRKVTAISNTLGTDIRRVEFRLTYVFQGRNYAVEMATVRSIDD